MRLNSGLLKSRGEKMAYGILNRYFRDKPYVVHKEVQLRQLIEAQRNEMTSSEWAYYVRVPFDFVVCRRDEDMSAQLVIEFDGLQHQTPEQQVKDELKNGWCMEVGLHVLRVSYEETKIRSFDSLLSYMLDMYFGEMWIDKLKTKGLVSDEEEFFPGTSFPPNDALQKQLIEKHGIIPGALVGLTPEPVDRQCMRWFRTSTGFRHGGADGFATVEVIQENNGSSPVLSITKSANVTFANPSTNVPGIHTWHVAQELALYLALSAVVDHLESNRNQ